MCYSRPMDQNLLAQLQNYSVPESAVDLIKNSQVVFLVGIAGAGKDTILSRLVAMPDYHHIVSHTTRPPRANHGVMEQNGVEYHFISLETASTMLESGGYIEAKPVHGNVYGTSVAEIKMAHDEGKIAISDIEVQGISEYRAVSDTVIPIFILPPSFDVWQARLMKRYEGNPDPEDLKTRMRTAQDELREALEKDYYEFVINDDLEHSIQVADEIAHGNFSTEKNEQARKVAEQLLADLNQAMQA